MGVKAQILQRFLRTGDESSQRSKGFGEGAINERNAVFHAKLLRCATTMFATGQHGVGFVNENARAVGFCDIN